MQLSFSLAEMEVHILGDEDNWIICSRCNMSWGRYSWGVFYLRCEMKELILNNSRCLGPIEGPDEEVASSIDAYPMPLA